MAKAGQEWKKQYRGEMQERAMGRWYKISAGTHTLRILPNVKSLGDPSSNAVPFMVVWMHGGDSPNGRFFIRCGKNRRREGACWMCDKKIPALLSSDKSSLRKKGEQMQASECAIFQVAWVDENDKWHGPKGLRLSLKKQALGNRLITFLVNPKVDFYDPVRGRNITIERTGTGMKDTRYGDLVADDEATKVPRSILSAMVSLGTLAGSYSEELQQAAYRGEAFDSNSEQEVAPDVKPEDEDDVREDEEEDETPRKKKKKLVEDETPRKKKKKQAVEPEEEEEEEEEEEDEDEEDEEPEDEEEDEESEDETPRKKKKKPVEDEEDEEEDEESEDEEEDDPIVKASRTTGKKKKDHERR